MNTSDLLTRVVFFQVRDNAVQAQPLAETAHAHFEKKEPFLIFVEDEKALQNSSMNSSGKCPKRASSPTSPPTNRPPSGSSIAKVKKNLNSAPIRLQPLLHSPL